jgi:hypothetical protein
MTGYPDLRFFVIQSCQANAEIVLRCRPRSLPSKPFLTYYTLVRELFDVMYSELRHCRKMNYKQEVPGRTNRLLSFGTTRTAQKTTPPTILLLLRVFVATGTCLLGRCLTPIRWDTHKRHTD